MRAILLKYWDRVRSGFWFVPGVMTRAAVRHRPNDRAALLRQAEMIVRGAREALPEDGDRRAVEERFREASRALS